LLLSAIGGVGLVVGDRRAARRQIEFGRRSRPGLRCLPYTVTMLGFAFGGIFMAASPIAAAVASGHRRRRDAQHRLRRRA